MDKVLLICKQAEARSGLSEILRSLDFQLIDTAISASEGRRKQQEIGYDLVIVNTPLNDEFGVDLTLDLTEQAPVGVILMVKNDLLEEIEEQLSDSLAFVIQKPINRQLLIQTIRFACQSCEKVRQLENQNEKLRTKLDELAVVYRGKLCLMENLSMSEDQAHRYLQKKAMDLRLSPAKMAANILKTYAKKRS